MTARGGSPPLWALRGVGLLEVLWGDAVVLLEPSKRRAAAPQALDADLQPASHTPRPATAQGCSRWAGRSVPRQ